VAKKTLYQTLQVSTTADEAVIKAAYETRIAALKDSAAPEVAAERIILREAYELLADPVRKKLYDEKLREQFRALSGGGGEEARARPANARVERGVEPSPGFSGSWVRGVALLLAVGIIGTWVWLDHRHKAEALRLQEFQQAEEARLKAERANLTRETVDWAKDRSDAAWQAAEERRREAARQSESQRFEYERQRVAQQDQMEERRRMAEQQRADAMQRRQEQEDLRRSQQQLERDRRYLQEMERNRVMNIPSR
jgi:curved DNA-binding protein CbpA